MKICVFGASSALIDEKYFTAATNLGEELVKHGHSLVFGAGATGLMGAVGNGVKAQNGYITGIIPKFFTEEGMDTGFADCDELIRTDTMADRKEVMRETADAFIILPGGIGTLEEFFEVFSLMQLGRHKKPIAALNVDGFFDDLKSFLYTLAEGKFATKQCIDLFACFTTATEVLDYIDKFDSSRLNWKDLLFGH